MEDLWEVVKGNSWAGVVFGGIFALYIVGEIEERRTDGDESKDIETSFSDGLTTDEKLEFHLKKVEELKLLKERDLSIDELVLEMRKTMDSMKLEIEALREQKAG